MALTHGAGGGIDARDLLALSISLPMRDISVMRIEMPWVGQGRKVAPAPSILDQDWRAVHDHLRTRSPMFMGGRSAGARVACRTAKALGARGVVALAFPLHPPGRPEKSRADEVKGVGIPTLVVQGDRDPFGTPFEFPFGIDLVSVPGANHEFDVAKSSEVPQSEAIGGLVDAVEEWICRQLGER